MDSLSWGCMLLRLLLPVCLISLSQLSLTQQSGGATPRVPDTCPVTKPYQTSLFVPPSPYAPKAPKDHFWFGTDKLWTVLPETGKWGQLGHYKPGDPTFRQKLFWFRQGYDWRTEPQPRLKITGRRLDSSAPPLLSGTSNGWQQPDQPFMVSGINFPTFGCWEIKGQYEDDELTFVVWVPR